jgi:hypothetical protein
LAITHGPGFNRANVCSSSSKAFQAERVTASALGTAPVDCRSTRKQALPASRCAATRATCQAGNPAPRRVANSDSGSPMRSAVARAGPAGAPLTATDKVRGPTARTLPSWSASAPRAPALPRRVHGASTDAARAAASRCSWEPTTAKATSRTRTFSSHCATSVTEARAASTPGANSGSPAHCASAASLADRAIRGGSSARRATRRSASAGLIGVVRARLPSRMKRATRSTSSASAYTRKPEALVCALRLSKPAPRRRPSTSQASAAMAPGAATTCTASARPRRGSPSRSTSVSRGR